MVLVSRSPDYERQVREIQRISHELSEIHKMENPDEIKRQFDQIKSELSNYGKRLEKSERIQGKILKQQSKILQQLLSTGFDGMKKEIKEQIKTGLTELEMNLMKLDLEFYKPDLKHLHDMNNYHASETTEE